MSAEAVLVPDAPARGFALVRGAASQAVGQHDARAQQDHEPGDVEIGLKSFLSGIIGASASLSDVMERVACVAPTKATVLITGETGTGKELIARAIHAASPRAKRPLVRVNCAALPEGLLASELFGHERGAFTGAVERRKGRFELANGGTIFLDEIGELSPAMQVALLRVLQEGEFERVGGTETLQDRRARRRRHQPRPRRGGARRDASASDLLFRLNVVPILVPPLRERGGDIRLIAEHYASHYASKLGKRITGLSPRALVALEAYPWPGNVRELQNVIERATILASGELLQPADLELPGVSAPTSAAGESSEERACIEEALRATRGRVSGADGAAARLGVAASTLEARIRRLRIDKFGFRTRFRE